MSDTAQSVHSVIIPIEGLNLLLPNAAVAEIVPYRTPTPVDNAPPWLLGMLAWREQQVPLLSFELAVGRAAPKKQRRSRIAVLNAVGDARDLHFFAIITRDFPQLIRIDGGSLEVSPDGAAPEHSLCSVSLQGLNAVIPDLSAIERMVAQRSQQFLLGNL